MASSELVRPMARSRSPDFASVAAGEWPLRHDSAKWPAPSLSARDDLLLTDRQLAARWSCSPKTLRNQRSRGKGCPFVHLGRLVRYRLSDVLDAEQTGGRPR